MNLILPYVFTFLDLAPMKPITYNPGKTDRTSQIIVIVVLLLFLAFIGYLIWKAIKDKRDNY